jgi:hypothetical protein
MFHRLQENFSKAEIIHLDTDGFLVKLVDPINFIWEFFRRNQLLFDLSRIDPSYPCYSNINEFPYAGCWKVVQMNILEVCCLRSKCYSMITLCKCGTECSSTCRFCQPVVKCSGVPKQCLNRITHNYYLSVLREQGIRYVHYRALESKHHSVGLVLRRKVGFHPLSVSRLLLPDGINTVPHGYYGIDRTT